MARKFTKISQKAFETMQFGAGLLLNKFDPTGATTVADADIICATTGGVTVSCTPNVIDLGEDVDNCPKNTVELMEIDGWDCGMTFTALNASPEVIKLGLGAADVSGSKIKPRMAFDSTEKTGDFKDVWWVGDLLKGGYVAVKLCDAISTSGLSIKTTDKGKGNLSVTLTACVRMGSEEVPMEFYSTTTDGE